MYLERLCRGSWSLTELMAREEKRWVQRPCCRTGSWGLEGCVQGETCEAEEELYEPAMALWGMWGLCKNEAIVYFRFALSTVPRQIVPLVMQY